MSRGRQMARRIDPPSRRRPLVVLAGAGLLLALGLLGATVILGGRHSTPPPVAQALPSPTASASPSASAPPPGSTRRPVATLTAGQADQSRLPKPSPTPTAESTPSPAASPVNAPASPPPANSAPQTAADFDVVNGETLDIGFPLRSDTRYHYRDNWYQWRAGAPEAYNHARVNSTGQLVRLHDGIDIYAAQGEPVLSPFDGTVVDPTTLWTPWEPERYGGTVVVRSDEPECAGYYAIMAHLDRNWVHIGQHVSRGQVVGTVGRTGDAEDVDPQLHFELRAPFLIDWSAIGEDRQVDAFNPYTSLVDADPKRQ